MKATIRTIEAAEEIVRAEGVVSWLGLRDPERLGCEIDEHRRWLQSASEEDIRGWARNVARDE